MPVTAKLVRVRLLCGRVGQVTKIDRKTKRPVVVGEFSQAFGDEIEVTPEAAERMCAEQAAELIEV